MALAASPKSSWMVSAGKSLSGRPIAMCKLRTVVDRSPKKNLQKGLEDSQNSHRPNSKHPPEGFGGDLHVWYVGPF